MRNRVHRLQGEGEPPTGGRAVLPHRNACDKRRSPTHTRGEARGGKAGISEEARQGRDAPAEGFQRRRRDESHRVRECHGEGFGVQVPSRQLLPEQPVHVGPYGGSRRERGDESIPHHRRCDDAPHRLLLRVRPVLHRLLLALRRVRRHRG